MLSTCPSCWRSTASWQAGGEGRGDRDCAGQLSSRPTPTQLPPGHRSCLSSPCHCCSGRGCGGRSHDSREASLSLECRRKSSQQTSQGNQEWTFIKIRHTESWNTTSSKTNILPPFSILSLSISISFLSMIPSFVCPCLHLSVCLCLSVCLSLSLSLSLSLLCLSLSFSPGREISITFLSLP